ncbi:replication-relaxation family protein [Brevibacillus centrosporus]|uniref:replication-relaxation family protein n=1 Tax=Brevibacillus centrosporus TaxID=54910 RepID=UPI0039872DD8
MAGLLKRKATEELDNEILVALYDHRHLTLPQLCVLCGYDSEQRYRLRINRRLQVLMAQNCIRRKRLGLIGIVGNPVYVYYLTDLGVSKSVEYLGIPFNRYGPNNKIIERNHFEAKELLISERLLPHHYHTQNWIVEFIQTFRSLYGQNVLLGLDVSFKEPKRVASYLNLSGRITHRPDWIITVGQSNLTVNLEMDMGTMNQKKLTAKFLHYAEWLRDNPQEGTHAILFTSHTERNITRRRHIKNLAFEILGEYIRSGKLEVVEGSIDVTSGWLISNLSKLVDVEVRDLFSDSLRFYYDPNSTGTIGQYDYVEACEKLGYQIPRCDKVHFLSSSDQKGKHKVIFQINSEPGSCQTEANCAELSTLAKTMSNADYDCFVYLVHRTPEKRMDDIPVLQTFDNVYSIDMQTLSQKGFKHAWKWSESKGAWKRVEVDLFE